MPIKVIRELKRKQITSHRTNQSRPKKEEKHMRKVIDETMQEPKEVNEVSDDVRHRLSLIIEEEGNRIRKEADQESAHIIARAREQYMQRLTKVLADEREKVRRQAQREAAEIIAKAQEERRT